MIMFPMMIAYGILGKPGILFYIIGIITMVFVPFIPIIIASILGTLITYVSSRFRYSNFVNILISIIVLIGIMGISLIIDDSGKKMADMSRVLTNKVNTIYPLSGMYQKAVCDYDLTALIAFLVISVGAFLCYSFIVGRLFRKMNTMILTGKSSVKYKMGELKLASPCKALYKKELKRYFSSTIYVLNTGFGIVLLTIGVIALLFIDKDKLFSDPQLSAMVGSSGTLLVSFCVVTCCTTMASISLEGKNLWIIKSLPVSPGTIFKAKIAVNMTIAAPAVIDAVIFSAILHTGFINCIITVLITVLYIIFTAVYGLIINLKFPNFNWTSETVVVKQSASCLIAVFTGMGVVAIQFLMVQFFPSFNIACAIFVFILTAADIALYKVLMSYGVRRFMKLQN
jgi:ABC-2 type transport system permease protein